MGPLRSTQSSSLNFRQLPAANGTAFFKDFVNRGQPREVYPNFRIFFPGRFLEFSVEWFAFNFRDFWKLFPAIPIPFTPVSKFSKVLVEWKAPNTSKVLPFIGKLENILLG